MAKENDEKLDEGHLKDIMDDRYANVSPNIKKELQSADKEKGPKAPGVTE